MENIFRNNIKNHILLLSRISWLRVSKPKLRYMFKLGSFDLQNGLPLLRKWKLIGGFSTFLVELWVLWRVGWMLVQVQQTAVRDKQFLSSLSPPLPFALLTQKYVENLGLGFVSDFHDLENLEFVLIFLWMSI